MVYLLVKNNMILYINTTKNDKVELQLKKGNKVVAKSEFNVKFNQAEKLLPGIDKLLKKSKTKLRSIKKIEVENQGGTFSSLRIGVITANALGFALDIPVIGTNGKEIKSKNLSIVKPIYNKDPNITVAKKKIK